MKITTFTTVQPNGVKRVTTLTNVDGWIRKTHNYTAPRLDAIARQRINAILSSDSCIDVLPVPRILQKELSNQYLNDKLCCNEVEVEYVETNTFEEPFLNIGKDGRLYYQQCFHTPPFVYERNIVNHIYYTLHRDDVPHEYLSNSFSSTFSNALAVLSTSLLQSPSPLPVWGVGVVSFGLPSKSSTAFTNSGLLPSALALW